MRNLLYIPKRLFKSTHRNNLNIIILSIYPLHGLLRHYTLSEAHSSGP